MIGGACCVTDHAGSLNVGQMGLHFITKVELCYRYVYRPKVTIVCERCGLMFSLPQLSFLVKVLSTVAF